MASLAQRATGRLVLALGLVPLASWTLVTAHPRAWAQELVQERDQERDQAHEWDQGSLQRFEMRELMHAARIRGFSLPEGLRLHEERGLLRVGLGAQERVVELGALHGADAARLVAMVILDLVVERDQATALAASQPAAEATPESTPEATPYAPREEAPSDLRSQAKVSHDAAPLDATAKRTGSPAIRTGSGASTRPSPIDEPASQFYALGNLGTAQSLGLELGASHLLGGHWHAVLSADGRTHSESQSAFDEYALALGVERRAGVGGLSVFAGMQVLADATHLDLRYQDQRYSDWKLGGAARARLGLAFALSSQLSLVTRLAVQAQLFEERYTVQGIERAQRDRFAPSMALGLSWSMGGRR